MRTSIICRDGLNENAKRFMRFFRVCSLAAGLFFLPVLAGAQVGATTDISMGRVTSPDGKPVVGAKVEVTSIESQIVKTKTTNADGRYSVVFPDGGGAYRV